MAYYRNLIKWTKEDYFSKKYILVPLNLYEHWSLLAIVNPKDLCEHLINENKDTKSSLIYFDSLSIIEERFLVVIKM